MKQDDNFAPIIGMIARANRTIQIGETYHFFINGTKYFGRIDSIPNNIEVYIRTEATRTNQFGQHELITVWYIINKKWLLSPADLFGLLN